MYITVTIILILMIVFFSIACLMKLFSHQHMINEFRRFKLPYWLARFAGAIECIGVIFLILGFWDGLYIVVGSVILSCTMVGAAYINFVKRPLTFGYGTLLILVVCLIPGIYNMGSLTPFIDNMFGHW